MYRHVLAYKHFVAILTVPVLSTRRQYIVLHVIALEEQNYQILKWSLILYCKPVNLYCRFFGNLDYACKSVHVNLHSVHSHSSIFGANITLLQFALMHIFFRLCRLSLCTVFTTWCTVSLKSNSLQSIDSVSQWVTKAYSLVLNSVSWHHHRHKFQIRPGRRREY